MKHKILIVDDDRIIRRGLTQTIPWEENNFEIVGEAGDGEQALAIIQEKHPQVVISDIRMPFMDGLELAKQTKELFEDIKFIFLTGYEDFSYAKTAIDLQAIDYLLKPVDRDVLLEKAKKAAAVWSKEQGQESQLENARPYLRGQFFQRILSCEAPDADLIREGAHLGLDIDYPYILTMLVCIDDYDREEIHPKAEHRNLRHSLVAGLDTVMEEALGIPSWAIFALEHEYLAVMLLSHKEEGFVEKAEKLATNFCDYAREKQGCTLTIGLGSIQHGLANTASSFDDAHSVFAFRHVIGKDTVIRVDDIDRLVLEVQEEEEERDEDLVEKVRLGLVDDAQQLLSIMEGKLRSRRLNLTEIRLRAVDMLLGLFKGAEKWAPDWWEQHAEKKSQYYREINQRQTVSEIMDLLHSLVDSLAQFMLDENSNQRGGDVIDDVTGYIELHYAEHGLSLQDIGHYVHMNPIYLSVLFKKKKKITFTGFLLQIRMTKAMEMLRATDLKTYEVAEQTGYSSPEYFGACFKKYTGCSPLEFRNRS